MTLAIVSIVAIAANVVIAWLIGRKPPLPDEERTEVDGMRLN